LFTTAEIAKLIRAGAIVDAKTIIGFFAWRNGSTR
jgi:hypothetical protein